MHERLLRRWRQFWIPLAGHDRLHRRVAARLASWQTEPYHGRAFLSFLHPRGFIAHNATVSHSKLTLGSNVYIGDRVIIGERPSGGPVVLKSRVQIYGDTIMETGSDGQIEIGPNTHIQPGCHFHAFLSDITIGASVEIAANCAFYSYNHGMAAGKTIMSQPLESKGPITVGDGAWLGHAVIVLAGVRIGAGAVVGAGSVVARDIPDNAIAAGTPARVIRFREKVSDSNTNQTQLS